ncbi:protein ADM2 [Puntigrus tetrazona]|uniref:protein ADM2 n=1 Tax=Puntigrus tetrazona TaxID=1606681 RepID=UPI001C89D01A|nr:protein ADM2 [Puntigrus tetrazona]XP_043121017.1 protein ADM2 [Puntigrus tetrazona]
MKSLLLVCVFLLPLQTPALPLRNRSSFPSKPGKLPESRGGNAMETVTVPSIASSVGARERRAVWRALLHKGPPAKHANTPANQSGEHFRERRHVLRGSRGRLMRVGCVLGTCQVQNLSHRLYQLNGQSGRQDAPINPRSPHSYG